MAVDVDEVLVPFVRTFLDWRIARGLSRYRVDDLAEYDLGPSCGPGAVDEAIEFLAEPASVLIAPVPGAIEAIEAISRRWRVVAVTSRFGRDQGPGTEAWLRHWLPGVRSVVYTTERPGAQGTPKPELCRRLGASWLVDDVPGNLRGLRGTRGLLFGEYRWQRGGIDGLLRARNWRQAVAAMSIDAESVPSAPLRREMS